MPAVAAAAWCGRKEVRASLNWLRPSKPKRNPDANNSASCPCGRWCARADACLGVEGIHIRSVTATGTGLLLHVETGEAVTGCPVRLLWAKRLWRCPDPGCGRMVL